eukprot:5824383-Prymnesium_polylepis.1
MKTKKLTRPPSLCVHARAPFPTGRRVGRGGGRRRRPRDRLASARRAGAAARLPGAVDRRALLAAGQGRARRADRDQVGHDAARRHGRGREPGAADGGRAAQGARRGAA